MPRSTGSTRRRTTRSRSGDRLLTATPAATGARVAVEEYAWDRIEVDGTGHDHAFVRRGGEVRTTTVEVTATGSAVESGLTDLVVLKSTGSEFTGFLHDQYTTLADADDRVLATSLTATWRWSDAGRRGARLERGVRRDPRRRLLEQFATTYSRALQETLWADGPRRAGAADPRSPRSRSWPRTSTTTSSTSTPFGVDNDGEVFIAADRPYGLIEATVTRDDR